MGGDITVDKDEQVQGQVQANNLNGERTSEQKLSTVDQDDEVKKSRQSVKRDVERKSEEIKKSTIGGF